MNDALAAAGRAIPSANEAPFVIARLFPIRFLQHGAAMTALIVASLAITHPAPAQARETAHKGVFNPKTFTLKNGLQVVVITNRRAPVALHMLWYKIGAIDEPAGKSGIAHFLEHLLFKSTKTLKVGQFSRIVAANGGQENAFTSWDYTGYYQFVAKDRLGTMMRIEADRMANLVLAEREVRRERQVILEERRSRIETRPSSILWEQARRALFLNHRYGRPIIGWMHEMKKLSRQDALDFYRRYYGPNNAVLVVAGDVDVDEVRKLAEKYYGPVKRVAVPPRRELNEPPQRVERRVVYRDARVRQPSFGRLYYAPSYNVGATQHAYALQVLARLLGSSSTSLLYQSLVVRQKLATSAGSGYSATRRGPSTFYLYASPRRGVSVEKLEKAIDAEIARVLKDGVKKADVEAAKRQLQDLAIFARDSVRSGANAIATSLMIGRTVNDVEEWPARIGKVTVEQVNAAARHVLQSQKSVTAILLPKQTAVTRKAEVAPK